ncbi:Acetylglutamate kinase [Methanococcoides burtonii DSM 6242]|uniref:Acetylglutamate kinase n=2 Tax=Methanococcoides burtonii TaxID=29291 RepID=ARGB_METBU|nr:RecName: Full=Acetylglutamate kinase; AltName: Full=N-acetyl-L-glutamate 5-phosphotransferase; AltName: Full=NAG kinase; Short=NAGK [Methanococcoides burtonii DSM 6242]ABE51078.1 Acetylglutamate kinase [Methanococcoides burtonii DSM 6242]
MYNLYCTYMTGKRENVLIEALPYIREFHDSVMVIKVGGHAMVDPQVMSDIVQDIVLLRFVGIHPVIVHGGGPEITEKMDRMGKKSEFIGGLRITDDETMEIARMVLVGNINTRIVSLISKHGGKGVGLSGKDGNMILAKKKPTQKILIEDIEHDVDLGWVGDTEIINPEIINIVTANGYIPVISPIAMDSEGNALNINADTVAGDLADALNAKKLILMTDVPGVLRDQTDISTRISRIGVDEVEQLIEDGVLSGGMIPKMRSAKASVEGGVDRVHVIDGSISHSVLLELFTDQGIGTMVYKDTK